MHPISHITLLQILGHPDDLALKRDIHHSSSRCVKKT
jgi:hypothetical protein